MDNQLKAELTRLAGARGQLEARFETCARRQEELQAQLDDVLLQQAVGGAETGMFGDLSDALVRSLSRGDGGGLDVEG